ncbi:BlaI/MecI/CopY family transcriptional regulator [Streptomyces sp. NPDC001698]|uniref:BlaI/MecI/CopY family transcriptional regulator n=1 Tax=Streptomyces sp. NPDC001698 TaxID=3364601 RepID=UPI0036BED409
MDEKHGPPLRGRPRRGPGELEASVLTALGSAPGPVTAGWVRKQIDPSLAYTTVVTTLTRLHGKQAVVRRRDGRSYVWRAVFDAAGLAARRMHRILDGERDRGAVLSRFIAELPPDDERLLQLGLDTTTTTKRGPGQLMTAALPGRAPCPARGSGHGGTASGGRATGSVR